MYDMTGVVVEQDDNLNYDGSSEAKAKAKTYYWEHFDIVVFRTRVNHETKKSETVEIERV
ncbi:uncharacterized protein PHALS_03994 [Plasmopara halstedii]|uniref:Uncharacterized protein n=1 Tax=Plasmopara halstedii TaxID=4781 RepID=A0A0P1A7U8_PLAHL|nr:uncharacterized protein PHALS_03994 [Plasmopara halstedii]CEG36744.1 hypothetical protein PHALS_03994 [Plasmopara halstedii]|eukprot:XP_024573113.1 hypothetical protein PHALS_03994 [Plasmopara halstedii]